MVLHNYLLAQDLVNTLAREKITGLTAVPPLYMQLVQQRWPEGMDAHLRYFANTGGRMPQATLQQLRTRLPRNANGKLDRLALATRGQAGTHR